MKPYTFNRSKTTVFFYKMNLLVYIFGFPNFWIEDLKLSKRFIKIYDLCNYINNALINLLVVLELSAFFTQYNLTKNQSSYIWLFGVSHPFYCIYVWIMTYHKENVKIVVYKLAVTLKEVHNDPEVERQMIRSSMMYVAFLMTSCLMACVMYNCDAYMDVVRNDIPYTIVITAYPDVHDRSNFANIARVIFNIAFAILISRAYGIYTLVIPLATCLSHQYKNLQSYFYGLSDIFDRKDLNQKEKEDQYERQFKIGIKFHSDTLRCTQQTHAVCSAVFSGQIILNLVLLVVIMAQMVNSERNMSTFFVTTITATALVISTGFFMWNAGDVTVEASHLSMAMYLSGWHNCQGQSSIRIRKLITISMTHAQRPVVLKGLGYIVMSYQSYLTIVKSSYSVFSVLF